ncbi:hypothetical protein FIV42_19525 [Persicimonas caeni]|uniref:1,4-alpha-glucan branching enzyme n=1 Tax=Persicimonas caeni TaxID=2292766 RepID=A0A4Y6PYP2_PERCE|nr:hypothetical protein [Persicimonas caeni]QDG52855.1 hypothetical protein FIV42_19525 [Persicimonas caeni]QED34077.1 hypothetical protein FRD00_19520 [Persicimonas caeni]
MASHKTKATTDHDEIRHWAEERDGRPATVKHTSRGESAGLLRFKFPTAGRDENLEEVSWDEFFSKFDNEDLAMIYQEETQGGDTSRFFKFVSKETAREATEE